MKTLISIITALLFIGQVYAVEPYLGVYGTTDSSSSEATYLGGDPGIIAGVQVKHYAVEVFREADSRGDKGFAFRIIQPIGSLTYSIGIGGYKEYGRISDTSGNWDSTTVDSNSALATMGLVQVEHSSGLFLRYYRYSHENTFIFEETTVINDETVVLDSKSLPTKETREKVMLGYKYHF